MKPETCLLCEESLEGIFTAVYEAYRLHLDAAHTRIVCGEEDCRLFTEYLTVAVDQNKAVKVMRTLQRQFGSEALQSICMAASSANAQKADAIYHTIALGLRMTAPPRVMERLAEEPVRLVFELSRGAVNELLHLQGFLRFEETADGTLFARIGPKNDILPYLTPHFADRLPQEHFVIYDDRREYAAVHPAGKSWYVRRLSDGEKEEVMSFAKADRCRSEQEAEYQELFRYFCHKIAIKERENRKLQQNMLPLRFQSYMTEFVKKQY